MIAQQQAEAKLDLRLGGGGGGAGGLAVGGGGGHQAGPGPPSPLVAEKPLTQPVITNNNNLARSPPVPKPAPSPTPCPAPLPVKPAPARPVSYNASGSDNSVQPTVHSPPPPPASSPPAPAAPLLSAPPPRPEVTAPHHLPEPGALRQPNSLARSDGGGARGRTPTRQERQAREQPAPPAPSAPVAAGSQGGYNFQKIMEDRFEHYKRPASRERSGSRQQLSRDPSRDRLARPGSRQMTPSQPGGGENSKTNGLAGLDLDSVSTAKPTTGNGAVGGGGPGSFSSDLRLPAEDQVRYRGVQQEIPHFGAPPKRTESLYMKPSNNQQATFKVSPVCPPDISLVSSVQL